MRTRPAPWLLTILALIGTLLPVGAKTEEDSDPGPHPLRVLRARIEDSSESNHSRGIVSVWLQNTTDVAVDGVNIELRLYTQHGRFLESNTKELGRLESGQKRILDLKWDIIGENRVVPRLWFYYNSGGSRPARFQADSPLD